MATMVMASISLLIRPRWLCSCTTTTTSARLDHGIVQACQNYQVSLGEDNACDISAFESQGNAGVRVGRRDALAASAVAAAMFFSVEDSEGHSIHLNLNWHYYPDNWHLCPDMEYVRFLHLKP